MAIAAGGLLALYLLVIAYALLAPMKQHDPQRGQAEGCLMIIGGGLLALGAALGIGVAFDLGWLVSGVFWVVAFPVILVAINLVRYLLMKLRPR